MSDQRRHAAAHTRLPNLMQDWLLPLFPDGAAKCVMYIVRHTVGFADPSGRFGRKERDAISIDQFVNGITTGPDTGARYLFDVGCGLRTSDSVRKSLEWLLERGVVDVRYVCPKSLTADGRKRCDWEQAPGDPPPATGKNTKSPACPRCNRTCARSWALAEIAPKDVIRLLNELDPQHRQFTWDPETQRPTFTPAGAAPPPSKEEERDEALRLRGLLWYPGLVDKCVKRTEAHHPKRRAVTLRSRMNNFYKPVLELQERYVQAPAVVKYAITQALEHGILDKQPSQTVRWWRYATVVCERNASRYLGLGPEAGSEAAEAQQTSLPAREQAMRDLLRRAASLNGSGDTESARALLADIIAQASTLSELFGGDEAQCETALREAFKQGSSDFVAIKPFPYGLDYYPEWSAPDGVL